MSILQHHLALDDTGQYGDGGESQLEPGDALALLDPADYLPEPDAPGEPRLPMADWIEVQAQAMRLMGSNLATWLAARLDDVAAECRFLQAETPDEFDARAELWAGWVRDNEPRDGEGGAL